MQEEDVGLLAGGKGQRLLHHRLRRARAISWYEDVMKWHCGFPFFSHVACKDSSLPSMRGHGRWGGGAIALMSLMHLRPCLQVRAGQWLLFRSSEGGAPSQGRAPDRGVV